MTRTMPLATALCAASRELIATAVDLVADARRLVLESRRVMERRAGMGKTDD